MRWVVASSLVVLATGGSALAGPADVISASADCSASVCTFVVTVRHDDDGWSHYANSWEVLGPDGAVLATRVLRHPHVGEQPFTRELHGVEVPSALTSVRIRARDSVHGFGGREVVVPLSTPAIRPSIQAPAGGRNNANSTPKPHPRALSPVFSY